MTPGIGSPRSPADSRSFPTALARPDGEISDGNQSAPNRKTIERVLSTTHQQGWHHRCRGLDQWWTRSVQSDRVSGEQPWQHLERDVGHPATITAGHTHGLPERTVGNPTGGDTEQ